MVVRRNAWTLLGLAVLVAGFARPAHSSIPEDTPPGPQRWAARYDSPESADDQPFSLVVSPDGSKVFATGRSYGPNATPDYMTLAYSAASGEQLWAVPYDGPGASYDAATSLAVSPDGATVFVTGASVGADGNPDYATLAYAGSTGALLWAARYEAGPSYGRSVTVSPDGSTVFVTGGGSSSGTYLDFVTIAYSAASGAEVWRTRYDGPASGSDEPYSLAVSPDGSTVFVTGLSSEGTTWDNTEYATIAYSASTGDPLWAARYDGPGNSTDIAQSVAVSPDGGTVVVTGWSTGASGSPDYATIAYSAASGASLWTARYDGPGQLFDGASSLAMSPAGSAVFVTGQSWGGSTFDFATIAYSVTSGDPLWTTRYNGPANSGDLAAALVVSPDGSTVFVTGQSFGGSGSDYATAAYSAGTGAQLWVARYNGPASLSDRAHSLAVSPDGSTVFVTGESYGAGSGADYATVAYRASSCANGRDEEGPVSGPLHSNELSSGAAAPFVHVVNCEVVTLAGL